MGPAGTTLQEFRQTYHCSIAVSARGQWHPNALEILGRTIEIQAVQSQICGVFKDFFTHVEGKFGPTFSAQFMLVLPAAVVGRMTGLEGSRIRAWQARCGVHLELRNSIEILERLLVVYGCVSNLASFQAFFS